MREVFLKKVSNETQSIYISNDEIIVGHTDNSILVEKKMDIFYKKWNKDGYEDTVGGITDWKTKLIGDLDRVIIYLNGKYDGKPYRILPTEDGWRFVSGFNTPSFLSPIKSEAIDVLCRDYKFLLDKLRKSL